ncbi:hypothetical protein BDF14DRAFT_1745840 [Spinellus fusiger]|nr:hypothetical protein BDF14DRAFT_1745840 [Spinellus fusiger]
MLLCPPIALKNFYSPVHEPVGVATTKATHLGHAILTRIFGYLTRSDQLHAGLTCNTWSQPALQLLWSSFTFVREREFERVFAVMARHNTSRPYSTYVKSLSLTHAEREFHVSANTLFLITSLCSHLECIILSFHAPRIVSPAPPPVRSVLPPIKRTHEPPHTIHRHTHPLPLAHFAYNCPKLKHIQLISYSPKIDDSVYELAKYLTSGTLETVIFSGCSTLQSSTLCKLAMTNPQLRHIEIMGSTPVSDSALATIADRCGASLKHLSIGNAYHLTDKSMYYVAKRCHSLQQLCIFNNPGGDRLTEAIWSEVIKRCQSLELVSMSNARCLGTGFFEAVVTRVEHELRSIGPTALRKGLQRLCLGNLKRDTLQSSFVHQLIQLSASEANEDLDQDSDEEFPDDSQSTLPMMNNAAFMPKMTVVRGSSIWWQRRRSPIVRS